MGGLVQWSLQVSVSRKLKISAFTIYKQITLISELSSGILFTNHTMISENKNKILHKSLRFYVE